MTIHNDGIFIPDIVLINGNISWREKMAYGFILKYAINKDKPFIDPRILANKMVIHIKEAIVLMARLKDEGYI